MANQKIRPKDSMHMPASYDIFFDGNILDSNFIIKRVYTKKEVNKISRAIIELLGGDSSLNTFSEVDNPKFEIGKSVLIKIGFDNKHEKVFEGIIESHSVVLNSGYKTDVHKSFLRIECVDKAIKLTKSNSNEIYFNSKESDIIKKIVRGSVNIDLSVEKTEFKYDFIPKYKINDWSFIKELAAKNGMLTINSNNKIIITDPRLKNSNVVISNNGETYNFFAKQRSENQLRKIELNSLDTFNEKKQTRLVSEKKNNLVSTPKIDDKNLKNLSPRISQINFSRDIDVNDLKKIGESSLKYMRLRQVYGKVSFLGIPNIDINSTITLDGFGKKFNGDVYVSAVSHQLVGGTIISEVQFGLNDDIFRDIRRDDDKSHSEISGTHIGKITDIEKDPKNEFRVKVVIPELTSINNNIWDGIYEKGIWAKLSHTYVSDDSGFFFIPEIGTQVVITFIGNDPSKPIVIGSLYNNKNKPIEKFENANNYKAIAVDKKMILEFDSKNERLILATRSGNYVVLDDKKSEIILLDKNKSEIKLSKKGIDMKSSKNLNIQSAGEINIISKSKINLSATSNISLKGSNIVNNAKIKFSAQGSGSTELKSSGTTEVKGSIVKIN